MTVILRAFSPDQLETAQAMCHGLPEILLALQAPVNGEALCMPVVCNGWDMRAASLGLPKSGVKRDNDMEAYMQGAMAALIACGLMTVERANMIGFVAMVGDLPTYVKDQASSISKEKA